MPFATYICITCNLLYIIYWATINAILLDTVAYIFLVLTILASSEVF